MLLLTKYREEYETLKFRTIEGCQFTLLTNVLITYGKTAPSNGCVNTLAGILGQSIVQKEFDPTDMERLMGRLVNIKHTTATNSKDAEVRKVSIAGKIDDLDAYEFMNSQREGRTIDSIKGMFYFTEQNLLDVKVTRKGSVAITYKGAEEMPLWWLMKFVHLIEDTLDPEEWEEFQKDYNLSGEEADSEIEDAQITESEPSDISSLF